MLINYATNPDKTDEQVLTAYIGCDPGHAARQMMDTKRATGKTGGRQCYHIIQSFAPGEVTPELALQIAHAPVSQRQRLRCRQRSAPVPRRQRFLCH